MYKIITCLSTIYKRSIERRKFTDRSSKSSQTPHHQCTLAASPPCVSICRGFLYISPVPLLQGLDHSTSPVCSCIPPAYSTVARRHLFCVAPASNSAIVQDSSATSLTPQPVILS